MSVGDVEQVFDPTALIKSELITNRLFDDHIVRFLGGQELVDVLCRSHCVHLVRLGKERKDYLLLFSVKLQLISFQFYLCCAKSQKQ